MTRLDVFLHENSYAESRSKARELILDGKVSVGGKIIKKPSAQIEENAEIEITAPQKYVSRGGFKLETAVEKFNIDFSGLICLDAGAGAGGFTDLMLQNGAEKVCAIDVGENQLHQSLRENKRVVSLEKQDIRALELSEKVDFITADLSFISLRRIIPEFARFLKPSGKCIVLIKPQFEAGKVRMKNGVLTDEKAIEKIIRETEEFIKRQGYYIIGTVESKLNQKGKNREYVCYFCRDGYQPSAQSEEKA